MVILKLYLFSIIKIELQKNNCYNEYKYSYFKINKYFRIDIMIKIFNILLLNI